MPLHRYSFVNSAFLGATTVTASSELADLPASNLKSPARGALWRSTMGWNVIAGFNDLLLFGEGAGPTVRVATITSGLYVLGSDYATAVQTAMNAAPSAANTYTVTYSTTTNLFTIERATGASAFSLVGRNFGTAAQYLHSALRDLGFYQVLDTSVLGAALTYTGSRAVFHGLEYVDLDQGQAAIRVVIVAGINDSIDASVSPAAATTFVIAPGIYSTPADLCAAVEAAADPSDTLLGSLVLCTWDEDVSLFTLENQLGNGVTLYFASGASVAAGTSAAANLGFAAVDRSLAPSGGADSATAESEVWGWNQTTVANALDHNAGGGGIFRLVLSNAAIAGQFHDTAESSAIDFQLGGNELQRIARRSTTYARRYLRLVIEDPTNEDGLSEVGILWAGPLLVPDQDFTAGGTDSSDPKDVVSETEYGAVVGELRPAPHVFDGAANQLSNAERDDLQEMQDYAGLVRPILFMRDATDSRRLISMTWYMRLNSPLNFAPSEGVNDASDITNPFPMTWSVAVALREIMP